MYGDKRKEQRRGGETLGIIMRDYDSFGGQRERERERDNGSFFARPITGTLEKSAYRSQVGAIESARQGTRSAA